MKYSRGYSEEARASACRLYVAENKNLKEIAQRRLCVTILLIAIHSNHFVLHRYPERLVLRLEL